MSFTNYEDPQPSWLKKLLLSEKFSDCTIWVKNSNSCTRFPGHKNILSSQSNVFAEALEESSNEDGRGFIMEDMNPDAVVKVLEYIYLGKIQLEDWKLATDVLKVVEKYKIPKLIGFCEDYVMKSINAQIVCYILQAAISISSKKVENQCKLFCQIYGFVVLNTGGFQKASSDIVKMILSDPKLQIENELQVFRAAWKWATYKCCKEQKIVSDENAATEIQPLLHYIDFKSMPEEELKNIPETVMKKLSEVGPKSFNRENISLTQIQGTNSIFFPPDFLKCLAVFEFDINHTKEACFRQKMDLMTFTINASIYLVNIKLAYKAPPDRASYSRIELYIRDKNKTLAFAEMQISFPSSTHSFPAAEIPFLKAHEKYTIEVKGEKFIENYVSFGSLSSLESKRLDDVEITLLSESYGVSKLTFAKAP